MGETKNAGGPAPDFETLRTTMQSRKDGMPKRLAQAAAYAISNPDDIAFGTAASIAAKAEVQPSTLVRLAHHLGYEGFSDLQRIFRERLKARPLSYEDRLKTLEGERQFVEETELLNGFLNAASQSIGRLADAIEPGEFARAVDLLANAAVIYLVARRRAYPVTAAMAYSFGKLGIRFELINSPFGIEAEQAQFAGPGDAAIVVSFSPYAADTVAQAEALAGANVPLIAITDSIFSPLSNIARACFEIVETDFSGFRSLSATMALAMALPVAVAEKRRERARKDATLDEIE